MITSNSNARIRQLALWQTKAKERRAAGVFLAEGFKMFLEAPEEKIREVYLSEDVVQKVQEHSEMREKLKRTGFETVTPGVFRKISDTLTPQGILCVITRMEYRLEELLAVPKPVFVVLENLQDPGNLGTVMRTGEGAGITGIIMNTGTVDIYNPKTIRATMGSVYRVPFVYEEDLCGTVRLLRERGIRTYAAHLGGEKAYDRFSYREGTAFLIGNEGRGLSPELAAEADNFLKIPMEGRVESLNAAVSAALLMYEAHRQRQ
ncbi:MAG: RNA methyltransferase [Lachnospiraceae bacterium]|nr:RNA methyltransferase [Lachnospiraceae bacterium]